MAKADFNIDATVPLARNYTCHKVRDRHLLIVGERPTWLVLDDSEHQAFLALSKGSVLRDVLKCHPVECVSRLLAKIDQAKFYATGSSSRRNHPPKLTLYVTSRCNLRCVHCYAAAGESLPSELTTGELLGVIEQYSSIVKSGEVTVSGGEPTLHL